jgi:hypothetical protein
MSILSSTNSGIHGIKPNKELLIGWLKEIGYDTLGSYYVAVNYKYRFLPNVNFEEVYVHSENKTIYYINVIKTNPDQNYLFLNRYIINTYADFITFKNDINAYIDKYVTFRKV